MVVGSVAQVAVEPSFVQLGAAGASVELGTSGIGPAVAIVEAQGAFVGVKNPQAGVGEAAGSEAVEGGGVELGADAAAPDVGLEIELSLIHI